VRFKHLRGLSGTKPGSLLRQQIPIQGEVWDEKRAGFLEADSVAHCGSSLAGSFVWSLTYTDIASTWTSGRAVWNKGATGVLEQTRQVEENLPFALLGMDFDNGSEWLNWHLIRYLQERSAPIRMTRSWPYNKKTAFVLRAGSAADSPFPWGEGKPALHKLGEGGGEGELSSGSEAIKRYSCWCPKVLAKIGHFPDTLADRCIIIRMQRKSSREQCDRFRNFDPVGLKEQCARFVEEHS